MNNLAKSILLILAVIIVAEGFVIAAAVIRINGLNDIANFARERAEIAERGYSELYKYCRQFTHNNTPNKE